MSRRLIISGGREPRELVLVGRMIVGRDPACDVSESDPLLSRRHAEFVAGAKDVTVRDLGSRNGILVNGIKKPQAVLRGGDVVQVGHLQVRYLDEPGPFLNQSMPGVDLNASTPTVITPVPRTATRAADASDFAPTVKMPPTPLPAQDPAAPEVIAETTEIVIGPGDRFRFEKPKNGWRIVPGGAATLMSLLHDTGRAALVIERATLDESFAPNEVTERFARHESGIIRAHHPEAHRLETKLDAAGERRVVVITYTRTGMAGSERVRQYSIRSGAEVYRLTCSAQDAEFAKFEPMFAYAAASFHTKS